MYVFAFLPIHVNQAEIFSFRNCKIVFFTFVFIEKNIDKIGLKQADIKYVQKLNSLKFVGGIRKNVKDNWKS